MKIFDYVKSELKKNAEEGYREFSSKIIPNAPEILGVRLPILRQIAKKVVKSGEWEEFLRDYPENCLEETQIKGLVITYLKADKEKLYELCAFFAPKIDNWAVCDIFTTGLKFFKKDPEGALNFLKPYLKSDKEFLLRFGVVALLSHFTDSEHIDFVLETLFKLSHDGYYAKMGIAWAISVCYAKFPERTFKCLQTSALDEFTLNKSISKICDSFRISKEEKEKVKKLRRKKPS